MGSEFVVAELTPSPVQQSKDKTFLLKHSSSFLSLSGTVAIEADFNIDKRMICYEWMRQPNVISIFCR